MTQLSAPPTPPSSLTPTNPAEEPDRRNHAGPDIALSPDRGTAAAMLMTARPAQWIKNLLVIAAPAAAGVLLQPGSFLQAAAATVAFILAASATYFLNDARDLEADRNHPIKRTRPIAAGQLRARTGYQAAVILAILALGLAAALGWAAFVALFTYLVLTTSYSLKLKNLPVVDILAVATGFVLRAATGAFATGVPLTSWFLLVVFFGALFVVTTKRQAELAAQSSIGPTAGEQVLRPSPTAPHQPDPVPTEPAASRVTLTLYTMSWLVQTMTLALTGTVLTYSLWAVQFPAVPLASDVVQLSILPFIASLLRYGYLASRGAGQAPESLLLRDRFLIVASLTWTSLVTAGIYLPLAA